MERYVFTVRLLLSLAKRACMKYGTEGVVAMLRTYPEQTCTCACEPYRHVSPLILLSCARSFLATTKYQPRHKIAMYVHQAPFGRFLQFEKDLSCTLSEHVAFKPTFDVRNPLTLHPLRARPVHVRSI